MLVAMNGGLFLVPTPIGNLEDITHRAIRVFKEVELILAEDTRRTRTLLDHFSINTPLTSVHEHNERARSESLIQRMLDGARFALCSDAGTPLISDPGEALVAAAIEAEIPVESLPGANAAITALCASGISSKEFRFVGFLSRDSARKKELARFVEDPSTIIFYESPRRLKDTLSDLRDVLGERRICVARELSKLHEELIRGTASEVIAALPEEVLGEITVVVEGAPEVVKDESAEAQKLLLVLRAALAAKASTKDAAQIAADLLEIPKKVAYQKALELGSSR
jgi:16S rRNA (cytidine1402-2'-O)-methyltransferase